MNTAEEFVQNATFLGLSPEGWAIFARRDGLGELIRELRANSEVAPGMPSWLNQPTATKGKAKARSSRATRGQADDHFVSPIRVRE
jgi:hypothetical protein